MFRTPRTLGAISLAAVVAVFGGISAAHAGVHNDGLKKCNSTGACQAFENLSTGNALQAFTEGEGKAFLAQAPAGGGDGADIYGSYIGVIGRGTSESGYPFVGTDQKGNDLFYVDGYGDVYYAGSLTQFSKTRQGERVGSFATQEATRTIEDVGSAKLVNGESVVSLDPTYAQSIDLSSAYHVFLTPGGDTKGLYVAQKSPTTFVVRETQGGHGSLSFDYRIVATQLGAANQRMGLSQLSPMPSAQR